MQKSKITNWVNTSLHLKSGEYQDFELAKKFKVDIKNVCDVTGQVNKWMVKFAKQGGNPLMFWHTYGHKGVWFKLMGDQAGKEKQMSELRKNLYRQTTFLDRLFAVTRLQGLTPGMKRHLHQQYMTAQASIKLSLEPYNLLPVSQRNKVIEEFLAPYKKELYELLGWDDEEEDDKK